MSCGLIGAWILGVVIAIACAFIIAVMIIGGGIGGPNEDR